MSLEEKGILGRLACQQSISLGECLRRLISMGLAIQDPEIALRIARARDRHRRQRLLL